jgi:phosphate:Na+ symporter
LPFCRFIEAPLCNLLPDTPETTQEMPVLHVSLLDDAALTTPGLALANLKREVMRMEQVVKSMVAPVMDLFDTYDKEQANALAERDDVVNSALDNIRRYVAAMPADRMTKQDWKCARELTEYAIELETVGDLVVKILLPLAKEKSQERLKFSAAGALELVDMHERMIANMGLASNVLVSDDLESARLLLEEKTEMTRLERKSRKKHLRRLSDGSKTSFESSDIHLEVLRALREINSHVASVCYPILYRGGQLLETRLIETIGEVDNNP